MFVPLVTFICKCITTIMFKIKSIFYKNIDHVVSSYREYFITDEK